MALKNRKAIALAGIVKGVDGEVFNVVDDDLPSSRQFLRMFKKQVGSFSSFYVPHFASYLLCLLWENWAPRGQKLLTAENAKDAKDAEKDTSQVQGRRSGAHQMTTRVTAKSDSHHGGLSGES